jgi:hypothetical protein
VAGKAALSSPLVHGPPLVLHAPRIDARARRELIPTDPLYALASWVHHHGAELPRVKRAGLLYALERAWPLIQGDVADAENRALAADRLKDRGCTTAEIADLLCVSKDRAQRLVRQGAALVYSAKVCADAAAWSVKTSTDQADDTPEDPASHRARHQAKNDGTLLAAVQLDLEIAERAERSGLHKLSGFGDGLISTVTVAAATSGRCTTPETAS